MNIEAIVDHFDNEMASVPKASGSLATVHRRARRRRTVRGIASGATAGPTKLVALSTEGETLHEVQVEVHEYVTGSATNEKVEIGPPEDG